MTDEKPTINQLFAESVRRYGDRTFLSSKVDGQWISYSYNEAWTRVRDMALGLYSFGIRTGDRLAIWSENRPEWNFADLASLAVGAADVPIYTTQARGQIEYVLNDSGSRAMFVSRQMLPAALEIMKAVKSLELIISFDEVPKEYGKLPVMSLQEVEANGRLLASEEGNYASTNSKTIVEPELSTAGGDGSLHHTAQVNIEFTRGADLYDQLRTTPQIDDLATQIYTSGTTGEPKGVMLSHRNLAMNALNSIRWLKLEGRRDTALSYLPLSHIFERGVLYVYMYAGISVSYAESIDTVAENLAEVRPTVMTSVPRMFEKMYARIVERGMSSPFPQRQILMWGLDVARDWAEVRNQGRAAGPWLSVKHTLAERMVYRKLREAVGGRVRCFISGGAPLAPEIAYVFTGSGLPILQGYGLTETSPSVACNTEDHNRIGTVGRVIDGVQIKFEPDGEILLRGDTITKGYYRSPEKNREAFTEDGWFRTGDIGNLDSDGYLVITDRKKDLIKTSGGKYIAPQQIESMIMASRFVSQVVVVGNMRKFASALIYPNVEMLRGYADLKGIKYLTPHELIRNSKIVDLIQRQVDKYTADLARFEKIKKVALLENELTTETGELTPTLKPRRKFIETKYKDKIDGIYLEAETTAVAAQGD